MPSAGWRTAHTGQTLATINFINDKESNIYTVINTISNFSNTKY